MDNNSGIHPQGWRILVKPLELEEQTKSGIIISHGNMRDREEMANTTGEVIEVGLEANAWAKAGDRLVFAKYAGLLYQGKDGVKYRIINDTDVVASLDADVKLVDPYLSKGMQ